MSNKPKNKPVIIGLVALAVVGLAVFYALQPRQTEQSVADSCGYSDKITVADMTWLSASVIANVTVKILNDGLGCDAELVPGDTVPTGTSMLSKGLPHVAPEFWVSTARSVWEQALEKGSMYKAGDVFSSGGNEGWWIPDYTAAANPGLKSVNDLKDYSQLFRETGTGDKGRFYGCPPGWGCEIITNNLFKALDLGNHGYELFSPGSGANLKAAIARKVTRKEPIAVYYWGPTAVLGKYNLVRLDMPEYESDKFTCLTDPNCANPQVTGWSVGEVAVAVVSDISKSTGASQFLQKMQFPNSVVNQFLAWGDDNSASSEEVAEYFLQNHEDVWTGWVSADVAAKVKASL